MLENCALIREDCVKEKPFFSHWTLFVILLFLFIIFDNAKLDTPHAVLDTPHTVFDTPPNYKWTQKQKRIAVASL